MRTAIRRPAGGFTDRIADHKLQVEFPEESAGKLIPEEKRAALCWLFWPTIPVRAIRKVAEREYGMAFGIWDVHFKVQGEDLRGLCSGEPSITARIKGDAKESPKI